MLRMWEVRFTLETTWHYRKSTVTIVSLDLSDAKGLRSSSRVEQMTAYLSTCFGLHSKLRKQKMCNIYFPPKSCPLLLIASFLATAAAQLGHEQPCPTIAMSSQQHLSFSSQLQRRGQYQLKVRCSPEGVLSVLYTGL